MVCEMLVHASALLPAVNQMLTQSMIGLLRLGLADGDAHVQQKWFTGAAAYRFPSLGVSVRSFW
jgi:hypothetical protein